MDHFSAASPKAVSAPLRPPLYSVQFSLAGITIPHQLILNFSITPNRRTIPV
jgi:hypothetical protein